MISVFLAFVLSGDRVIAMFGIGLAAAVALDAFVLRTLLVPALMHMLGGANWWLPAGSTGSCRASPSKARKADAREMSPRKLARITWVLWIITFITSIPAVAAL